MDLNAPLGMKPRRKSRLANAKWNLARVAGGGLALAALAALGVFLALADPRGGEPYAIAVIPPPGQSNRSTDASGGSKVGDQPSSPVARFRSAGVLPSTQTATDPLQTGSITRGPQDTSAETGTMENGVKVFRPTRRSPSAPAGGDSQAPLIIDVSKALDDPLGRTRPAHAGVASSLTAPPVAAGRPRVAIFVSGMGLSQTATKAAMDMMPGAVTLAFVPYGATIAATVAAAKAKGHEILLQIPMQNGTGGAPGPHALRPGASSAALRDDLAWLTSRFAGYDGVTNLLGAPVTADEGVMTALLRDVGTRGLFYLDDGLSPRGTALSIGPGLDVRVLKADLVLDATADARMVQANLETLTAIARRKGSAIGMASGLPDHIADIARFASGLEAQGIVLVPVADLVGKGPVNDRGMAVSR